MGAALLRAAALVCGLLLAVVDAAYAAEDRRLPDAARARDRSAVAALLAKGVDVNSPQPDGATALHWAAHWGDEATIDVLLRAGANANAANDYGATPLWLASARGAAGVVNRLLKAGARPDIALPSGETPLMAAARAGAVDVFPLLLAAGAPIDARETTRGQTALMWAIAERQVEAARTCIERGADVRAGSLGGFTPLMFAAREGDLDTARRLLARGADVNAVSSDGRTALLVAVVRGHVEFAEALLSQGADPRADGAGYTALHWASGRWDTSTVREYRFEGGEWAAMAEVPDRGQKMRLIKALLATGADVNARITKDPPRFGFSLFTNHFGVLKGATPFFLAAVATDTAVMRLLVAAGANPVAAIDSGSTPLIVAAGRTRLEEETLATEQDSLDAVRLALELGGDVNAPNADGETALHAAAGAGLDRVVEYLVAQGAKIDAKMKDGRTPLDIAEGWIVNMMLVKRQSTADLLRRLAAARSETAR